MSQGKRYKEISKMTDLLKLDTAKSIYNDLKDYIKEEYIFCTQICAFQSLFHLDCNNCVCNFKVKHYSNGTHTYCMSREWKVK